MTPGGKRWLTGCAIGCALVVVVLGVLAVVGASLVGRSLEGFVEAGQARQELAADHGAAETFIPPGPGELPGDRLDLFLAIREELAGDRQRVAAAFQAFPPPELQEDASALRKVWSVLRGVGGFLGPMGEYLEARNEALLAAGMGEGEYLFHYGLVFYTFLGHRPGEPPPLAETGGDRVRLFDNEDGSFSPDKARRRYRFYTLAQMRNMAGDRDTGGLAAEIRRLESDPAAIAWKESLPAAWRAALEPRRSRAEAAWSAATNIFEWPRRPGEAGGRGLRLDMD